jgi:16S rRNA (cytosine1402-N4)-methyltransferase
MPVFEPDPPVTHVRRRRYPGRNPRRFEDKYKELDPERYPTEVEKVRAAGKTPAGMHVPIMVAEVLAAARPQPGDRVVDCTLGGGGHARALLAHLPPGGRLLALDLDAEELPKTEAHLRADGFGEDVLTTRHATFAGMAAVAFETGVAPADIVLADLGVSSMQLDNPARGFSYKGVGPLDMRMNPAKGQPASALLATIDPTDLSRLLTENADEPHATVIAGLLTSKPLTTTHEAERVVRTGLERAMPRLSKAEIKASLRRTFQALRIAVNDEFRALDALLRSLPDVLAPGGRVVILTFHSGEDRRVKQAFRGGRRAGVYREVAEDVIRPSMAETRANRRASSAKLRWAVRA